MQLFNTLAGTTQQFTPLNAPEVRMYSCGPTVYDHIHIGNLGAFIMADTLRRALAANGYRVHHVMNFTDVDDKTIARSQREYPGVAPDKALSALTQKYSDVFLDDMRAVGNDVDAINFLKATDPQSITAMQTLIRELLDAEIAYIADDGVYFSIQAYRASGKTYGQLSHITANAPQHARIDNDEYDKDAANDFALWKRQKDNEPSWEFNVAGQNLRGRPGWHIECSAMSRVALGQPFDIHTGGIDLIFPHHENEIAQSTAAQQDRRYAQFFVHNEHLLVDGKKMSKSLDNFYTLADIKAKGFDPLAFRLLVLQSHYRSPSHFTWANLEEAERRLCRFRNFAARLHQMHTSHTRQADSNLIASTKELVEKISHDLDTPGAFATIETYLSSIEKTDISAEPPLVKQFLLQLDTLFGLDLLCTPDIDDRAKEIIRARETARAQKDFAQADTLRTQLAHEFQVGVNDTVSGPIWFRLPPQH